MVEMKIEEGKTYPDKLRRVGENGWMLYFDKDMLDYLDITQPETTNLIVKADKGKHGKFLGIGKQQ